MLTDGVSGQEVPHGVSNSRQPLQALHIDQKAAYATADVLLTAENRGEIQALIIIPQNSISSSFDERLKYKSKDMLNYL